MADVSHRPGDITSHPDVSEMRERYDRVLGSSGIVAVDSLVLLVGLYAAISPWTVHFAPAAPQLALSNLIMGIAVAVLGLCMTVVPDRMQGLSGACAGIGIWLIVSPWVVTRSPGTGTVVNNIIIGGVICLLGLTAAGMMMKNKREA
ncbi:SPW repeat protein [Streptomyces sp. H10-C2]|uniref:SPW repeat protein n=1 Tax=unclassified Streptomyces TaxID=2593676 RepID=UPI0024BAD178|nr:MULTISPECIES: SPW repeat protein [unclassified Streptomyces]MDJ0341212.1 SPW repeat protein [Streptomyces sp. PH10-H1]MDJ0369435.1 SPW repeat protein [Streptomyces sp. H10-C2]